MKAPLNPEEIHQAIDIACNETSQAVKGLLSFRRFREEHQVKSMGSGQQSWLLDKDINGFAFVVLTNKPKQEDVVMLGIVSFYLAYSSWEGRMLNLGSLQLLFDDKNSKEEEDHLQLQQSIYYTLANIALRLDCQRFCWQHALPCLSFPGNTIKPETLEELLILRQTLLSPTGSGEKTATKPEGVLCLSSSENEEHCSTMANLSKSNYQKRFQEFLRSRPLSSYTVRLATAEDIPHIERLVHGLAVYAKEPDAVRIAGDHYRRDGFVSEPPLFYCFLVHDNNDAAKSVVCGMAFCYLAYRDGEQFLYLEDLFVEEAYRGKGIGSYLMKTLAQMAKEECDCVMMEWMALDWNTPALTFYDKTIGAKVQEGLQLSRFAGDDLKLFVQNRPENV